MATKKNLSSKSNYVPKRMINELEVERNGKTTYIDGADLIDGMYVKKGVKYGKGGLANTKYIPNYMVQSVEVERNGKTTDIDGGNILDGFRVKKTTKFGNGGGTAVSSQSGLAEGTNADLLMNQNYLQYGNGGGVAVSSESGLAFGTNAELLMNEQNLRYEDGGRMGTWCYEIGGL